MAELVVLWVEDILERMRLSHPDALTIDTTNKFFNSMYVIFKSPFRAPTRASYSRFGHPIFKFLFPLPCYLKKQFSLHMLRIELHHRLTHHRFIPECALRPLVSPVPNVMSLNLSVHQAVDRLSTPTASLRDLPAAVLPSADLSPLALRT